MINEELTLLVKGLLKNRLVKAAEGGTEIFKFREQELLIPVWHVVLGLRRLLETHRLGHSLWVIGDLKNLGKKKKKRSSMLFLLMGHESKKKKKEQLHILQQSRSVFNTAAHTTLIDQLK